MRALWRGSGRGDRRLAVLLPATGTSGTMRAVDFTGRRCLGPEPRLGSSVALLALGLVPSLLWALVGIPIAIWNFTDAEQRSSSSTFSIVLLVMVVVANLAPFVATGVLLTRARKHVGSSWPRALRAVAPWAGLACGVSFLLTAMATGGVA